MKKIAVILVISILCVLKSAVAQDKSFVPKADKTVDQHEQVATTESQSYPNRTIQFAGITWDIYNLTTSKGYAGKNYWSNSPSSVWVDKKGRLHLKIRKVGDEWYCAEISAQKSFGYGEYRFNVSSNVEAYDPNIVVGFFTYETDKREIDIEFSYWANKAKYAGSYTVQATGFSVPFPLKYQGANYKSTHKFTWTPTSIDYQSYHGFSATLPSPDSLIYSNSYTGDKIPPAGKEKLKINFWLYKGVPPTNLQEAEVVIDAVYMPTVSYHK